MSIKVSLNHKTHYQFDRDVSLSPHLIRLRPAPHTRIPIEAYSLNISPKNHFINWQQDPFGNHIARLVFNEKTDHLSIEVDLIAKLNVINPFDFFIDEYARNYPFTYESHLNNELLPYLKLSEEGPLFEKWLASTSMSDILTIDYLSFLNNQVKNAVDYVVRLEPGVQTSEETLQLGRGACRDMAWLLLQTLRRKGIAARFVSGYLIQIKTSGYHSREINPLSHDLTDLHAWVEAFLPGAGWIGLDPTAGFFASEGHVPLCCTPEPLSAAPVVGCTDVCKTDFNFSMSVNRLDSEMPLTHEDPYSEETWERIDQLGIQVDNEFKEQNVNLTMGGEPTFVAMDNQDDAEWTVSAMGEKKHAIACDLMKRLMKRSTPKSLLLHGQGKWYGGEVLPRWTLGCFWLKDGKALWNDPSLFAEMPVKIPSTIEMVEQFINELALAMKLKPNHIMPAYEDENWQHLLEGSDLQTSPEPERPPIGFILPLKIKTGKHAFQSPQWSFKRKYLFLATGTSPMGYRLPLKLVEITPREPTDFPTALCIELREGTLCLFIPPIEDLIHYCTLIHAIEATAAKLQCPVRIEGYPPPKDPNILNYQITPDPGVIEVNVYPASNWEQLKEIIFGIFEEAKNVRLTTEKYLIDGRRVGAGGGHHVIIGGATVDESPILKRPDLLQSVLTFWQHHPSLSYFFSGLFVGPTSQAPRIDEARHEALYELEIAFSQLPNIGTSFTQIDRLFRNLLVDITGNTHRTEISIDKLYDPQTPHGKQGLIEFRSFEMQPHPQMSLIQLLLVRTLVAYFWKKPYQGRLIRWGTSLHDRMMMPYFLWQDLADIVQELNYAGYAFEIEWFKPFFDFRFPVYGTAQFGDIRLELRMALEPWNVLGEESVNSHTARTVDSSTERLQVKIAGYNKERYLVTCNKRVIPLQPSSVSGEFIGAVRFKADSPAASLHPYMPVHVPLVFDIYDTWINRSIGGCKYHYTHPGGVNYAKPPVNAQDAESRRIARFEVIGHTPGVHKPSVEPINEEYPYTLDLRRPNNFTR